MENITFTVSVNKSSSEAFAAITQVKEWWTGEVLGRSEKIGDEFTYAYKDMHTSTQRVIEFEPGKKIVWEVIAGELRFIEHTGEWIGTKMLFEISDNGNGSDIHFTHEGITPQSQCYSACSWWWGMLIQKNLKNLIETGIAQQNTL